MPVKLKPEVDSASVLTRIWNYVSNNPLVAGLLVLLVGSGSAWAWVAPARAWLSADVRVVRGVLVVFALLLLIALAVILRLAAALRRERDRTQPVVAPPPGFEPHQQFLRPMEASQVGSVTTSSAALMPMPTQELPAPVQQFAPETFKRTPNRCRALLAMLQRVDARTTLHELHQLAAGGGVYNVQDLVTKAQLQHDMEDAERAGIVSIDRAGTLTQYYNLAIPNGRDWVLANQEELRREALKGVTRRDLRSP